LRFTRKPKPKIPDSAFPPSSTTSRKARPNQTSNKVKVNGTEDDKKWHKKEHAWLGVQEKPTVSRDKAWRERQRSANELKWDKTKRQWIPRGFKEQVKPREATWNRRLQQWMKATNGDAITSGKSGATAVRETTWRTLNRRASQSGEAAKSGCRWDRSTQQWLVASDTHVKGCRGAAPQVEVSQLLSTTESGTGPLQPTARRPHVMNNGKFARVPVGASITDSLPVGGELQVEGPKLATVYDQDDTTRPTIVSARKGCYAPLGIKNQVFVKDNLSRCVEDSLNQTNAVRTVEAWQSRQPAVPAGNTKRRTAAKSATQRGRGAMLNSSNVAAALHLGEARVCDGNTRVADKIANRGHHFLAPKEVYTNPVRGYGAHKSQVVFG
jgi:hypothetical protein